jgi:hypothetical protein
VSRWFRFYEESLNDPKVQRLAGETFKAWVNLLCLASKDEEGILPSLSDIAFALRLSDEQTSDLLNHLYQLELLDEVEVPNAPMSYTPHNWKGRQYKSDVTDPTAPKRQKAYRERIKDRNATVTVTPTRAETEQKQITEQKKETRVAALSSGFDAFWFDWPNKVGKPAALRAYRSVIARGATIEEILVGVQNYIRDKPPDRPWLNPATFLNQNRWEDRPAAVGAPNGQSGKISAASNKLVESLKRGFGGAGSQEHPSSGANPTDARLLSYRGSQ